MVTKVFDTPLELNTKLNKTDGLPLPDPSLYCCLVGSLIYLTMTCPDIAHAVQVVSQFGSDPRKSHLTAVHCIFRYLRGTLDMDLFYSSTTPLTLQAYAYADWAGCPDTRRSTTG